MWPMIASMAARAGAGLASAGSGMASAGAGIGRGLASAGRGMGSAIGGMMPKQPMPNFNQPQAPINMGGGAPGQMQRVANYTPSTPTQQQTQQPIQSTSQFDPMQHMALMGMMNQGQGQQQQRPQMGPPPSMNNPMGAPQFTDPNAGLAQKNQMLAQLFGNMGNRQRRF